VLRRSPELKVVIPRDPSRGFLTASTVWAGLSVISGLVQVVSGLTHWALYGCIVASGAAGVAMHAVYNQHVALGEANWKRGRPERDRDGKFSYGAGFGRARARLCAFQSLVVRSPDLS